MTTTSRFVPGARRYFQRPDSGALSTRPAVRPAALGTSTRVRGLVTGDTDLIVHGTVIGDIDLPGHALTIAEGGSVTGRLFARLVDVAGMVSGQITATDRATLFDTAEVQADISAPRLVLHEGARFGGRIDMKNTEAAVRVARYRMEQKAGVR